MKTFSFSLRHFNNSLRELITIFIIETITPLDRRKRLENNCVRIVEGTAANVWVDTLCGTGYTLCVGPCGGRLCANKLA